jgi:hypothetical protein
LSTAYFPLTVEAERLVWTTGYGVGPVASVVAVSVGSSSTGLD